MNKTLLQATLALGTLATGHVGDAPAKTPKKKAHPTFTLRRRDGTTEEVSYSPMVVIAGTSVHVLALHKDSLGAWAVSHPQSGAAVLRHVHGQYKGIRVSSQGMALKEIRALAVAEVDDLISRVGSARFNAVLANPKPF